MPPLLHSLTSAVQIQTTATMPAEQPLLASMPSTRDTPFIFDNDHHTTTYADTASDAGSSEDNDSELELQLELDRRQAQGSGSSPSYSDAATSAATFAAPIDELDEVSIRLGFDTLLASAADSPDNAHVLRRWLERLLQVYTPLSNAQCSSLGALVERGALSSPSHDPL